MYISQSLQFGGVYAKMDCFHCMSFFSFPSFWSLLLLFLSLLKIDSIFQFRLYDDDDDDYCYYFSCHSVKLHWFTRFMVVQRLH